MTLKERINELLNKHGTLRALGRHVRLDPGYLCRLRGGDKASPGPAVLRRLGLKRVVAYERVKTAKKGGKATRKTAR